MQSDDNLIVSSTPPENWDGLCRAHNCLVHSSSWQELLTSAFSARPIYILDEESNDGVAITVFKAGPFRIGYVGFPIGGSISAEGFPEEKIDSALSGQLPTKLHLLRTPVSAFASGEPLKQPFLETQETAITNLQQWDESDLPSVTRRNIRKSLRSGVNISDADARTDGRVLYRLYAETIARHGGRLRYNEKYFQEIVGASTKLRSLRVFVAQLEGKIAGYLVIAQDNNTAYYLHGASEKRYQIYRPNDLLFLKAIQWAKGEGVDVFNMMSSPMNQSSLVRYKEKWLGETRTHRTYEKDVSPILARCFRLANSLYQSFS